MYITYDTFFTYKDEDIQIFKYATIFTYYSIKSRGCFYLVTLLKCQKQHMALHTHIISVYVNLRNALLSPIVKMWFGAKI